MKKLLCVLLVFVLGVTALLAGCGNSKEETAKEADAPAADPVDVKVIALKGPTAMGMVQFMDEADAGNLTDNNYSFEIAAAVDEVTPKIVQGEVDIAAVPANLSSVLYNNTDGGVTVLAINTLGVLYIVEKGQSVQSVADLKGKTIYASGMGATPEYALNYILRGNGLDPETDVNIEWKSEHAECLTSLVSSADGVALLPQPFVTTALAKDDSIRVALDLNEAWDALNADAEDGSSLVTGVVVVRTAFLEEHPEAVAAFMEHYRDSVDYVNANVAEAAQLIEKYDIVPATVAEKALPACNIVFIDGAEMKTKLSGYLQSLFDQNPKAVGGTLPADAFYYVAS
ncbi:MAG: ABC transporter substrate-binding protein [Clostridiales Family XIII bacterium]|jgi:NitT/TauT family transport system substrate-binding protein|nr:ABC transporter substrate-binding protein [Clostridiales Family XIII bacterium]